MFRSGVTTIPFLLLLLICLALAPVQQFMGNRNPIGANPIIELDGNRQLESMDRLEELCKTDPVGVLEESLRRYRKNIHSYRCILVKKETIQGITREEETIRCSFREKPFSVLMQWEKGADKAGASLFVDGENKSNLLIRPVKSTDLFALKLVGKTFVQREVDDPDVRSASRYTVHEFGINRGTERTYLAWKHARDQQRLYFEYLGESILPEVGNRKCHLIRRTCNPPEEEGLTEITIAIDSETWFQVGSILKAEEKLIGYYYFKDIELEPNFAPETFSAAMLK